MITNVNTLISQCTLELQDRQYPPSRIKKINSHWKTFSEWMLESHTEIFTEDLANEYCDLYLGTHLIVSEMTSENKLILRSIRMLVSYQKDGEFEFRSPRVEYKYEGPKGALMVEFFDYAANRLGRSSATIDSYHIPLHRLLQYVENKGIDFDALTIDLIQEFLNINCSRTGIRHRYGNTLRQFFKYLYSHHHTNKDLSALVLPDNYNRHSKIPTTYTEDEIRRIIEQPDRFSALGKRDYLVLLLAGEYGWRSGDITHFRLDQIDWDKNVIKFDQQKTGTPIEFPLLSSVGNAIADYLMHGRPVSDCPEVILSAETSKKVGPLKSPTIHSIVTRYMKKANITGWKEKKHGAHSLRHSLASNLLKKNTSLPVISTVLGHQSTETTKIYLKVDEENLRSCCLPMPGIYSPYYKKAVNKHE